jgi:hypothetical protein
MDKLWAKKRIYQVEPPPETIEGWEAEMDIMRGKWGRYFKNNEQFEYFAMLPLTDDQRWTVLRSAAEAHKLEKELLTCIGKQGSSPDHRRLCIPCCLVDRQKNMQ